MNELFIKLLNTHEDYSVQDLFLQTIINCLRFCLFIKKWWTKVSYKFVIAWSKIEGLRENLVLSIKKNNSDQLNYFLMTFHYFISVYPENNDSSFSENNIINAHS